MTELELANRQREWRKLRREEDRVGRDRVDALFTEYAIEHIDWPDSEEELDRFLGDVV